MTGARWGLSAMGGCLVAIIALASVWACSTEPAATPSKGTHICWLIGCESGLLIRYPSPIDSGYVAVLSMGTWSVSLACPDPTGVIVEDGGGEYTYRCDRTSLDFVWGGEYPPDASWSSLTTEVTIRSVDGGTLVPETRVVAPLSSTFDPDPDCPSLCFDFTGEL